MKLSEHLTLKEVTYSTTAIKHGINNEPVIGQLEVLKQMAGTIFEPCREFCGGPLKVTSGYRGPDLNKRIGGALSSDHCINDHATAALDLDCDVYKNSTNADLFYFIKENLPFKQLIWEFGDEDQPNWVHVSWSKNMYLNKREVLVAKRVSGRTVYEHWKEK